MVGGRAGGGAGVGLIEVSGGADGGPAAAVSSDADVVVSGTAIVVEVIVGGSPSYQSHGYTGYSKRGSVAGVNAFRVFNCWQRRWREGGVLVPGCGHVCRCQGH